MIRRMCFFYYQRRQYDEKGCVCCKRTGIDFIIFFTGIDIISDCVVCERGLIMTDTKALFKDVPGVGELHYLYSMGDDTSPLVCVCLTPSRDYHFFCFVRTMNPITWGIYSVEEDIFDDLIFQRCDYSDLIKQSKERFVAHCKDNETTYEQVDSLEDLMGPLPIDYFDGQSTESICLSEFAKECEEIYEKENGAVESDE